MWAMDKAANVGVKDGVPQTAHGSESTWAAWGGACRETSGAAGGVGRNEHRHKGLTPAAGMTKLD